MKRRDEKGERCTKCALIGIDEFDVGVVLFEHEVALKAQKHIQLLQGTSALDGRLRSRTVGSREHTVHRESVVVQDQVDPLRVHPALALLHSHIHTFTFAHTFITRSASTLGDA